MSIKQIVQTSFVVLLGMGSVSLAGNGPFKPIKKPIKKILKLRSDIVVRNMHVGKGKVLGRWMKVPVRVAVQNRGLKKARPLKVSILIKKRGAGRFRAFPVKAVYGNQGILGVFTKGFLKFKRTKYVSGYVILPRKLKNKLVLVRSLADSCIGEQNITGFCRVKESKEYNNTRTLLRRL